MATPAPGTARVTISLPVETEEWLKDHAWCTRRTVSQTLREMIEAVRKEADNPNARRLRVETDRDMARVASFT